MADLVTRLLLDSSGFNNNIVKSSRQVQEFQQITGNIVGTIGKFALVLELRLLPVTLL